MNDILQLNNHVISTGKLNQQQQQQQLQSAMVTIPISATTAPSPTQPSPATTASPPLTRKYERGGNNKRSSLDMSSVNTKRSKIALSTSTQQQHSQQQKKSNEQTTPQLLQQLMAPSPVPQRSRSKTGKNSNDNRWNTNGDGNNLNKGLSKLHQSSNSVLMNLLVSGCDVSAGYTIPHPTTKTAAKA